MLFVCSISSTVNPLETKLPLYSEHVLLSQIYPFLNKYPEIPPQLEILSDSDRVWLRGVSLYIHVL